jgi:hypothetical protein
MRKWNHSSCQFLGEETHLVACYVGKQAGERVTFTDFEIGFFVQGESVAKKVEFDTGPGFLYFPAAEDVGVEVPG